jgi:oligopeptide transport system substrate-binding protein
MKKLLLVLSLICLSTGLVFAEGGGEGSAAMDKTLNRSRITAKIQPFDPADMTHLYTTLVYGEIGEALFAYEYLADNYVLKPEVAKAMPKVSADGLVYTIEMNNDVHFYDPLMEVFPSGKGRTVMAKDFVLTVKRLADPASESGGWWLYEGYIKGLDDWAAAGADYSKEVEGFKAIGDYTIQLTLTKPYPQILYTFAMSFTYPVSQELLDTYGDKWKNYPIGTGAYYYDHAYSIPGTKHVLRASPEWKGQEFPAASSAGPATTAKLGASLLKDYEGKPLPFCNTVVWHVIEEDSVRWLKFMNGETDISAIPKDNFETAVVQNELTPEMMAKGITLDINPTLDVTYNFFNMDYPILGQNKKLRQAMALAYNHEQALDIFYNFRGVNAQTLLPPGLGGYDPNYVNPYASHDLEKAKALLAEAGYPGGEGLPTFKYQMYSTSSTTHRQMVEFYIENMSKIGIEVEAVPGDWPTFLERIDNGEVELGGIAWGADYPDAQNFLQLNYGPNKAPGPNGANYDDPMFNELYEKGAFMQQSAERDSLYAKAAQMAAEDVAWIMGVHRLSYALEQPWTLTRVFRDIGAGYSKYIDFDAEMRDAQ